MKQAILRLYWCVTRAYLRFRGAELGRNVRCNGFPHIKIRQGGRLVIGDDVMINAVPWANAHVVSGSTNLFVAANAELTIGQRSGLSGCRVVAMERITIGEGCMIGGGCLICDSDMHEVPLGSDSPTRKKPIQIGNQVFLGANSMILKGVSLGDRCVVGAGAVVAKSFVVDTLIAGDPAIPVPPRKSAS